MIEAYIVARVDGRRVLIPLVDDDLLEIKYDIRWPVPKPDFDGSFPPQGPGTATVSLMGHTVGWRLWEDGANPEDLNPDRLALEPLRPFLTATPESKEPQ